MAGERWYITGLIISLLALSLVILGFRWSTLAARVPLAPADVELGVQPRSADASETADSAPDGAQVQSNAKNQASKRAESRSKQAAQRTDAGNTGRLNINQATAAQLEELPGIGPVLAARIVDYREEHGAFHDVDALCEVAGIGAGKLKAIEELVYAGPAD